MGVSKPTVDDLIGWLKLQSPPAADTMAVYGEAFDGALDYIESRVDNTLIVAQGAGDLTDDANYPQRVRLAVIMAAAKLAKRSTAPEGVAGFGGDGFVVRLLGTDADVEGLIARFVKVTGFS